MSDEQPETDDPSPPSRQVRIGRLDTVTRVRREAVRVYADMRNGRIKSGDGSRLVFVLAAIEKMIEFQTTEERIERLEQLLAAQRALPALREEMPLPLLGRVRDN